MPIARSIYVTYADCIGGCTFWTWHSNSRYSSNRLFIYITFWCENAKTSHICVIYLSRLKRGLCAKVEEVIDNETGLHNIQVPPNENVIIHRYQYLQVSGRLRSTNAVFLASAFLLEPSTDFGLASSSSLSLTEHRSPRPQHRLLMAFQQPIVQDFASEKGQANSWYFLLETWYSGRHLQWLLLCPAASDGHPLHSIFLDLSKVVKMVRM